MGKLGLAASLALAASLFTACATAPGKSSVLVKDVLADPDAYMARFDTVAARQFGQVSLDEQPVNFRRMEIKFKVLELRTNPNGAVTSRPNLGLRKVMSPGGVPGAVRIYDVWSMNDVPFRFNFRVAYRNVISLKWQYLYTTYANAEIESEVKTMTRLDSLATPRTEPAEAVYSFGAVNRPAGPPERAVCKFGPSKPASEIHSDLVGDYAELGCDFFGSNGQLTSHTTNVYLKNYGVAFAIEQHDVYAKFAFKVESVTTAGGPLPDGRVSLAAGRVPLL